jgi:hypothetical protein
VKALNACLNLPADDARDEWFVAYLSQPRLVILGHGEVGGFVFVRPARTHAELVAKAPVVERWVRRCAGRRGLTLGALRRIVVHPPRAPSADPLDYVGSLGVRIEVVGG